MRDQPSSPSDRPAAADVLDTIIVGAGLAGLATAASLRAHGVTRFCLLEQGAGVGDFWSRTYDRLHLHTAGHDLPHDGGLRARYPLYLARDEIIAYLRDYAALHDLGPCLRTRTRVTRIAHLDPPGPGGAGWHLDTSRGALRARTVAVATAGNRVPYVPVLPEAHRFGGRLFHSAEYRNGQPFRGRRVLVVGSGNSAAEICLDLVEHGAARVAMWVRAPRHFIPLTRMTELYHWTEANGLRSPEALDAAHRLTVGTPEFEAEIARRDAVLQSLSVDLARFGILRPTAGPVVQTYRLGRIAVFDVGAIPEIERGRIEIVDGTVRPIDGFTPGGVVLGGREELLDAVVLATGFRPGLDEFLADGELLGPVRYQPVYPLTDGRGRSRVYPSIFFPGFDPAVAFGLSLGRWGWEIGERIAASLR